MNSFPEPVKVLVLNNRYPSSKKPFVASYVKTIESLISRNHETDRLVLQRNSNSKWGQILDLILYRLKIGTSSKFGKADVVLVNHFNLYWKSLISKLKPKQHLVIHWHGSELFGSKKFRNFEVWASNKWFVNASHIVPSEYFKKEVLNVFPNLGSVYVVPSGGIDTEVFFPKEKEIGGELTLGFAGHLNQEKGADFLLKLAKEKETLEKVVGRKVIFKALRYGVKDEVLLQQLEEAGVQLVNPIPKPQMPGFYMALDVLLFPTRRKSESLGLVPLEAMACGVPVVCPDAFACPEYCIPHKSGELYHPEDFESFKAALVQVISNYSQYDSVSVIRETYAQDKVAAEYDQVISGKKSS